LCASDARRRLSASRAADTSTKARRSARKIGKKLYEREVSGNAALSWLSRLGWSARTLSTPSGRPRRHDGPVGGDKSSFHEEIEAWVASAAMHDTWRTPRTTCATMLRSLLQRYPCIAPFDLRRSDRVCSVTSRQSLS
jgi:hypothetical protein